VQSSDSSRGAADAFPVTALRSAFPALAQAEPFIFFDNAAGAQIPRAVLDAVNRHLIECNVQRGGRYAKSQAVDTAVARARESVAEFLNAAGATEVAFGLNATSFIRTVSLAIGQTLGARNEIVLTDMDHEANVAPWLALAREGATFRWWSMRDDGNLHVEDLQEVVSPRTRIVACTAASNAVGSVIDIAAAAAIAHAAGAELFVDCVHYAPHAVIDVQAWDCDYLVCSGYKIFAPHMGFMWGRSELLRKLPTFREDFTPDEPPAKIEAGTFAYESVAGMDAAIGYLASLGLALEDGATTSSRRANLVRALTAIGEYERVLSLALLAVLTEVGAEVYGVRGTERVGERVPTISFNMPNVPPATVCERLARAGIGVRDGHMYSPRLMQRLGLRLDTGAVRVSLVHYNTAQEIARFGDVLQEISKRV
jgi:cysteine desulfurase family protein (TIGR01976 family)